MEERIRKAFDFAQDSTKQFISLSTGIIALTITFSKDFVSSMPPGAKVFALLAWALFLLSVFFGVWTLLALTGTLEPNDTEGDQPSIRGRNVTLPSILQILSFFLGLVMTVVFGIVAVL